MIGPSAKPFSNTIVALALPLCLLSGCIATPPGDARSEADSGDVGTARDTESPDEGGSPDAGDVTISDTETATKDADAAADAATPGDVPPALRSALFVVNSPERLSASDENARKLLSDDFAVSLVNDDSLQAAGPDDYDLLVVSESADATIIGDALHSTPAGVFTWENNLQERDHSGFVSAVGPDNYEWRGPGSTIWLETDLHPELNLALSDTIDLYSGSGAIWYAPESTLGAEAEIVARVAEGSGDVAAYVYDADALLADGSRATARRAYLGLALYDVDILAPDGELLFKALASWASN